MWIILAVLYRPVFSCYILINLSFKSVYVLLKLLLFIVGISVTISIIVVVIVVDVIVIFVASCYYFRDNLKSRF